MAQDVAASRGRGSGYKFDRGGVAAEFGPFVGTVVNNVDPTRQGRLQVYIEALGASNPDDQSTWRTVSYCPPFYGATPLNPDAGKTSGSGEYLDSNPQSYGMWFTPPDLGTKVLCVFANGDPNLGYYVGCVPEQGMNHMIPAIGASKNFKTQTGNQQQATYIGGAERLPVVEIIPTTDEISENPKFFDQQKPVHNATAANLFQQGLIKDTQRGVIGSTSQRESPSNCYGISTPGGAVYQGGANSKNIKQQLNGDQIKPQDLRVIGRTGGHSIVMDDGDLEGNDVLVRIRSAKGHQITMSDDGNFFYIVHANGQTWLEFGKEGTVDVYSTNSINLRSAGTVNIHADKDINMYAGGRFNLKSKKAFSIESDDQLSVASAADCKLFGKQSTSLSTAGHIALSGLIGSFNGGGRLAISAGVIDLNGIPAPMVSSPKPLQLYNLPDTEFNSSSGWTVNDKGIESIVTRAPTHEPYPYHNKGVAAQVSLEKGTPSTPPGTPSIPTGFEIKKL